jgi:peptidoglycan/xylan/chitin deacetylase (PgdA/CDA1 family)
VRVVTVPELLHTPPDVDAVALTFDDGLRSFGDVAAPLLAEHGLPVTLFVVSDRAGATSAWPDAPTRRGPTVPTFPLLDWPALRRLADGGGGVELGAHTRTHRDLTRLRGADLAEEVDGCAARIAAETGRRPAAFAYPYGAYDAASVAAVARAYAWACTTDLRAVATDDRPHLLPRLDAYYLRAPGALEAWGTGAFRRRLWLRAGARRVRRTLTAAMGAA